MAVSYLETLAYTVDDPFQPSMDEAIVESQLTFLLQEAASRERLLSIIFQNFRYADGPILVAGSGSGCEVMALANFTADHIIALDRNIAINPKVNNVIRGRVTEEKRFLHDFLLANHLSFSAIVVSTGPSHGIVEKHEYAALKRSVPSGGIIICSWDSDLNPTQMVPEFTAHEIDLPYYPTVFVQE